MLKTQSVSLRVVAYLTGWLLLFLIVSAVALNEDSSLKFATLPRQHKVKLTVDSKNVKQNYLYGASRLPTYAAQTQDTDLPLQEATAGDTAQKGLEDSTKKLSQLYTTIRNIALPKSDTNSQRLVMVIPGKILSYNDYFPGNSYDKLLEDPENQGKQVSIPVRVMENMFALADAVPAIDPLRGADTGESMALIYKSILDWMQIKGFNEKTQEEKKHYMKAMEYLTQKVPDPFNVSINVTRFNLYRRAEDAYNEKRLEMEDVIARNRSALPQDDFERWFQRNYPSLNARVEAAYTEWLIFGEKEIVELYKAYLDVQAPGIDLEDARMALRASGVISLDRSRTIYPVSFVPSNWYRYLTDVKKVDEASKRRAMSGDQIRLQIGRLKAKKTMLQVLQSTSIQSDSQQAIDNAKADQTKAENNLKEIVNNTESNRQTCLAKRSCGMSSSSTEKAEDCSQFTSSSDNTLNTIELNSLIYSCTESKSSQLDPKSRKVYFEKTIANIDATIKEYEKELTTFSLPLSLLTQHGADDKEQLDANWMRFSFDSAASSQQTDSSSSYYSVGTSVSVKHPFFSVSSSYSTSKSTQDTSTQINNAKVSVQGELLRVTIQRPWFRPSLFRSAQFLMTENILVSPGDDLTEEDFVKKAMDRNKYLLPHYASAFLLSRNVSVEFREISSSAVFHGVQEASSFSAGVSVGLWGLGVNVGVSANWGSSQSRAKVESTENGLRITIPGVSLIGYYTQNVPLFPKT